jgi:hypothetical protein
MRLEMLVQFIVPLTFLAIWALTSLLNRDAQPLPPRPGRPGGAGGTRPTGRALGQAEPRPAAAAMPARPQAVDSLRDRTADWTDLPSTPAARQQQRERMAQGGSSEAIVYIESDPSGRVTTRIAASPQGSSQLAPRAPRGTQPRRGGRGRAGAGGSLAALNRAEQEIHRALSDQVGQSMGLKRNKPLAITPLAAPIGKLSAALSEATATAQFVPTVERGTALSPLLTGTEIRKMLDSPTRLREVAVLTEILRPPLALRHRRRP